MKRCQAPLKTKPWYPYEGPLTANLARTKANTVKRCSSKAKFGNFCGQHSFMGEVIEEIVWKIEQ